MLGLELVLGAVLVLGLSDGVFDSLGAEEMVGPAISLGALD